MLAYESHIIGLQDILYIRLPDHGRVETAAGRLIFNNALYSQNYGNTKNVEDGTYSLGKVMDKKTVGKLVDQCFQLFGNEKLQNFWTVSNPWLLLRSSRRYDCSYCRY